MKTVTVYSTQFCPYCQKAKALLKSLDIPFEEIDLGGNDELREQVSTRYKWQTVPMIVIGDEFIGGSDDLHKLHQSGKLSEKLED